MNKNTSTLTVCVLSSAVEPRGPGQAFNDAVARRLKELDFILLKGSRPVGSPHAAFVDPRRPKKLEYRDYFTGESTSIEMADVYIVSADDFSLLNALFRLLSRIDSDATRNVVVILTPKSYWEGLLGWFKGTLLKEEMMHPETLKQIVLFDDMESIVNHILSEKQKRLLDSP